MLRYISTYRTPYRASHFTHLTVRHFNTDAEHLKNFKWFFDMENICTLSDILENGLYASILCVHYTSYIVQ